MRYPVACGEGLSRCRWVVAAAEGEEAVVVVLVVVVEVVVVVVGSADHKRAVVDWSL